MRALFLLFIWLQFLVVDAQQLMRAEYFIDVDPSPGKGIPVPIVGGDSINVDSITFSVAGLAVGVHLLGFRVGDSLGMWSAASVTPFTVLKGGSLLSTFNNAKLIRGEYFIDKDPGPSKGVPITFAEGDSVNMNVSFPLNGLTDGVHLLGFRVRDSLGMWSAASIKQFTTLKGGSSLANFNESKLIRGEYFIDNDPGCGKGIPITFPKGDSVSMQNVSFSVAGLANGGHMLGFRVRDSLDMWSPALSSPFSIIKDFEEDSSQHKLLTVGEYFFGTHDPGMGKGVPFKTLPTKAETWDVSNLSITLPDTLAEGTNLLTFRLLQSDGFWTSNQTIPFDICLVVPPQPVATPVTICGGTGAAKLTASGASSKLYSWYSASYGGSPIYSSTYVSDSTYTTPVLTSSQTYWVAQKTSGCNSSRTKVDVTVVDSLALPTIHNVVRCGQGIVTLSTSGAPAGGTYHWYASDTSAKWLAEGATYLTDTVLGSRTYYVSAVSVGGFCQSPRMPVAVVIKTCVAQTISFSPIKDMIFGFDKYVVLNALATSGLPVEYQIVSGPARLSSDTLYPTGIGEVTVSAIQNGDTNYAAAASATNRFKVLAGNTTLLINYNQPVCTGGGLNLVATAVLNGIYVWTGPNGFKSTLQSPNIYNVSLADSGNYFLTVYAANDTLYAVAKVKISESPTKLSIYSIQETQCTVEYKVFTEGDSIVSYQWFLNAKLLNQQQDSILNPIFSGVYSVTGYNQYGCGISSAPIYINVTPDSLPVITRLQNPSRLSASLGASYQWYVNSYYIAASNKQVIPLVFNGIYKVEITDVNGCSEFSNGFVINDDALVNLRVGMLDENGNVNLEGNYDSKSIIFSPNPASDIVLLRWTSPMRGNLSIKVSDNLGREIENTLVNKDDEDLLYALDTSHWAVGCYSVFVNVSGKNVVGKILINR